jgi:hypothetical protein
MGAIKSGGKRGPRPGSEIAMGLAGNKSLEGPYGARNSAGPKSLASRLRRHGFRVCSSPFEAPSGQSSSRFRALEPAGSISFGWEGFGGRRRPCEPACCVSPAPFPPGGRRRAGGPETVLDANDLPWNRKQSTALQAVRRWNV